MNFAVGLKSVFLQILKSFESTIDVFQEFFQCVSKRFLEEQTFKPDIKKGMDLNFCRDFEKNRFTLERFSQVHKQVKL